MELKIQKTTTPRPMYTDESKLGFGNLFSDHMFLMDYTEGKGWHDARIVPYGPLAIDPSSMVLHYGQEVFEGLKAYRVADGSVQLFRPQQNFKRLNASNERMCIPQFDEAFMLDALKELVRIDEKWVPKSAGCSLYIRPFIFANDASLGVRAGNEYMFVIITSPSGAYYEEGINPVNIYVEDTYVRAVKGGIGQAKTGGNYAASIKAADEAKHAGFTQVLWLDGVERKYIEEVGTMNVFFVLGDEIVTPALQGSILPGITRMSVIELLKSWGLNITERPLAITEVVEAYKNGALKEAFGSGTAAVISPIGLLRADGADMVINDRKIGELSQKLYDELTGIQYGTRPDPFGWIVKV